MITEDPGDLTQPDYHLWYFENQMVARLGTPFPPRCVKTNQSTENFRKVVLRWQHPATWFLLVLCCVPYFGFFLTVGAIFLLQRKAVFRIGFTAEVLTHFRRSVLHTLIGLAATFGLFPLSYMWGDFQFVVLGQFAVFVALTVLNHTLPLLSVARIEDGLAYIKGAGVPFLITLPSFRLKHRMKVAGGIVAKRQVRRPVEWQPPNPTDPRGKA